MINPFRRTFLFGTAALATATTLRRASSQAATQPVDFGAKLNYPFAVPPLPYGFDANESSIDAQTMQLHHDKHHAADVSNLNAALKDHPDLHDVALKDLLAKTQTLPEAIRTVVRNNAGGYANHTMFWQVMGGKGGEPTGDVDTTIARDFGSFADLKTAFNKAATGVFGSGWAMVLMDGDGKLSLVARPNQDAPLMDGHQVLFGNDVWEHAYYLKYQNRRPNYLTAWWGVLDWSRIGERYAAGRADTLSA
ncbi:superoxide dismutase [Lichenihabitans psoromatis]|uniref:superoxide dismutase n=1 Tax=Lichenihabitans psoromatis TaxID=2528642 RepID=UPI0010383ED1|nr:superoxide dismutase [Lichenihabitans psoromatis]